MRSGLLLVVVSGALLGLLSLGPAPVGALQRAAPLEQRLETSRRRVLSILSKPDWYRPFLEMLRRELHHRRTPDNDPGAMPTLAVPDNLLPPIAAEAPLALAPLSPPRRSRRSPRIPRLELTVALKLDNRVCLNDTAPMNGSPAEAEFIADDCDAELRISARLTPKRRSNDTSHQRPTSPPAAAEAPVAESSAGGGYSKLRTPCSEENYCLFGGHCTHYRILDMHVCKCRPGFGGSRCEKYDVETVLTTLDTGRRQGVIGNGPIRAETHSDVLSVVESTALLLATDNSGSTL